MNVRDGLIKCMNEDVMVGRLQVKVLDQLRNRLLEETHEMLWNSRWRAVVYLAKRQRYQQWSLLTPIQALNHAKSNSENSKCSVYKI